MTSGGTAADRRRIVSGVATRLFGQPIPPERVIEETLRRATDETAATDADALAARMSAPPPTDYRALRADPLAAWVETDVRPRPRTGDEPAGAAPADDRAAGRAALADSTGASEQAAAAAIRATLQAGASAVDPASGRPLFAFRLHQFLSKGDTVTSASNPKTSATSPAGTRRWCPGSRASRCCRWRSAASVGRNTSSSPAPRAPARRPMWLAATTTRRAGTRSPATCT